MSINAQKYLVAGLSLVFGPEGSGLTNQELSLCHVRVRIPTSPAHSRSAIVATAMFSGDWSIFRRHPSAPLAR